MICNLYCGYLQVKIHKFQQPCTLWSFIRVRSTHRSWGTGLTFTCGWCGGWGREKIGNPWQHLGRTNSAKLFDSIPQVWFVVSSFSRFHETSPRPSNFIRSEKRIEMQQHGKKWTASCAWRCGQMHHPKLHIEIIVTPPHWTDQWEHVQGVKFTWPLLAHQQP